MSIFDREQVFECKTADWKKRDFDTKMGIFHLKIDENGSISQKTFPKFKFSVCKLMISIRNLEFYILIKITVM